MFASLTPRSDFRVVSQPGRGTADAPRRRDYSDRNWFEKDRADIGSFSTVAELEEIFVGNGRLVTGPDESSAD